MNKSSSSASSSPPFTPLPPPPTTASTIVSNQRTTASVIPLEYNYRIMSPSSLSQIRQHTASNVTRSTRPQTDSTQLDTNFDNASQYNSLFGDPVPPPPPSSDGFGSQLDSRAAHLFHSMSIKINDTSEEETISRRPERLRESARLFSNVPYASLLNRYPSNTSTEHNSDNFSIALPRLQPPDIQILPNSSGASSAEEPQNSPPNYALLAPNDNLRQPMTYEIGEPPDVSEYSETITISDSRGLREYSEATRRMSNFSTDFKANVGSFNTSPVEDTSLAPHALGRQLSNESYSSSEWFRPSMHDFPEFNKMPKLRPSSKNVMSIKSDEMPPQLSPVAAMINDSNGSSSGGEERLLNATQTLTEPTVSLEILAPQRPPEPSPALLREIDANCQVERNIESRRSVFNTETCSPTSPLPPRPEFSQFQPETEIELESHLPIKREMSPVIMRDSIATGSDFRVDDIRLHKKTSFTIISDRSPQSSRAQTPTSHTYNYLKPLPKTFSLPPKTAATPTLTMTPTPTPTTIKTSEPTVKPRYHLHKKSLTATELRIPSIVPQLQPSDDSPRPSVQFDMTGRYSPNKMPQKGILQHRESLSSSQETTLPTQLTPLPPTVPRRRPSVLPIMSPLAPSALPFQGQEKIRSYETLPIITDSYRTSIPRLHRSSFDVREHTGTLLRPLKRNPNPTRKQRGLMRIINSADNLSRIPLRSNWTASTDDFNVGQRRKSSLSTLDLQMRRRSSSTSAERRSSTQTASDRRSSNLSSITTSDFSFRRPSLLYTEALTHRQKSAFPTTKSTPTTPKRRQSIVGSKSKKRPARTKISKPTTLSPIIGTPNKENSSTQSPTRSAELKTLLNASESLSESTSRRESISKIPVRNGVDSRSNSRLSSNAGSQVQSRTGSPTKGLTIKSPVSGRTSRAESSRSPSRATLRTDSRPVSRADSRAIISRSSSRASTRPISREPPSLSSSRPNSRLDESHIRTGSRPNSRIEQARELSNSRSNSRAGRPSAVGRATSISPSNIRERKTLILGQRKSISLSPKAMRRFNSKRRMASPETKKREASSGKPLERRGSRSRIPTRTKSDLSATKSARSASKSRINLNGLKRATSVRKTTTSQSRKEATSTKKAPASVKKIESSVKRTTSSVSKPLKTATKKKPNNIKTSTKNPKTESLLKPEKKPIGGNLNKTVNEKFSKPEGEKQETLSLEKKTGPEAKGLKKQNSSKKLGKLSDAKLTTGSKSAVTDSVTKADSGDSPVAVASETVLDESSTIAATASATGELMSGMKRQPSTTSLIRMGSRLSLLNRKRPDSSLSRRITEEVEEPGSISAQQSDGSDTTKLHKVASSGQLMTTEGLPAVILEKSTKTLENIQNTVTVATDEIHRKINENLTDFKNLEQDMGRVSDGAVSPTASITTVVENRVTKTGESATTNGKSPQPPGQPIEASVSVVNRTSSAADSGGTVAVERVSASTAMSVLPEVDCESANFQNFALGIEDKPADDDGGTNTADGADANALMDEPRSSSGIDGIGKHRQSPDGQGGTPDGSNGGRTGSRELLEEPDEETPRGCCRCCARFCMPCRRARCSRCCHRKKKFDQGTEEAEDRPVLSATSSTTTTNLDVIDETTRKKKNGCWQKLNCCKKKKNTSEIEVKNEEVSKVSEAMQGETPPLNMGSTTTTPKQGKCGACLRKVFCCRSVNKVETTTSDDDGHDNKKCACFPCCRKKVTSSETGSTAWQDTEQGLNAAESAAVAAEAGCCKRFWRKIFCCCLKKKTIVPSNSRRASMKAPPPPPEDTRRKLHNDLVEYTSKMKGAIPVLPLSLAWFCAICNTVCPGLGTLFSGLFCICIGIPRFSQYDSAKARLGSFIINTIVAAAQLFCVLFCLVGWGWSIWWGTIMLKCAKKLSKIRKVERLEMEEEQRQAAAAKAQVVHAAGATETTKT